VEAKKKCRYCAMDVPGEALFCPYCRKRIGYSGAAKVASVAAAVLFVLFAWAEIQNARSGAGPSMKNYSGEGMIISRGFACKSVSTYQSIRKMVVQDQDKEAFGKAMVKELRNGGCVEITPGTRVFKSDYDGGLVRFRPEGDDAQYWTIQEAVQ
jgi:hypothetical protein